MPETTRTMAKAAEKRSVSKVLGDHPLTITWIICWTIITFFAIIYGVH